MGVGFGFGRNLGSVIFQTSGQIFHVVAELVLDLLQLFPIGFELLTDSVPFLGRGIFKLLDEFFLFRMELGHF